MWNIFINEQKRKIVVLKFFFNGYVQFSGVNDKTASWLQTTAMV